MKKIQIENIQIIPVRPQNGLVGFASCELNDQFHIGNIAIYTALNNQLGYRLVFPTKKLKSGQQVPCFYPFRQLAEEVISKSIIEEYCRLMGNLNAGNYV